MKEVQQEVLAALLLTLREKELISQDLYHKARETVLRTAEWPEWFRYART